MSHNPNTIKSQDDINEGGRKSDVLLSTIEELEKVKKENEELKKELKYMYNRENVYVTKFNIALDCVLEYSVRSNWKTTEEGESCYFGSNGYELAEETIDKLKKITKVDESKCERLQKQLDIAVKCLDTYANEDYWLYCCKACGGSYYTLHKDKINLKYGEYPARNALAEIKELNK